MKYLSILIVAIALFLVSCGDDDSGSPTAPSDYTPMMPLDVGNEWHYDMELNNLGSTVKVDYRTKIEETKNVYHNSKKVSAFKFIVYINEQAKDSLWMFDQDAKLYYFPRLDSMDVKMIVANNLTLEKAKTMEVITYDGVEGEITTVNLDVMNEEKECIRIKTESNSGGNENKIEAYYIPEVGLVKDVNSIFGTDGAYTKTLTLKRYYLKGGLLTIQPNPVASKVTIY